MDLWVVAAAAGAGYLAKHWQNFSGEKDGESDSSSRNSIHNQSESSRNFLQQIWDQTCPFRRFSQKGFREDGDSDGKSQGMYRIGPGLAAGDASTNSSNAEVSAYLEDEVFGISCEISPEFETNRLRMRRPLRTRWPRRYSVNPLDASENCHTGQLYRGQSRKEECGFSSLGSPLAPTVRPVLVTDGSPMISIASRFKSNGGISLEEDNRNGLMGTRSSQLIGSVELPRKPEQRQGKGRLSSSNTRFSGPFQSQGSSNGMLLFFLGITIGIMYTIIGKKREVDNLNELLKQTQNLVRDLHEELEMKDMLIVKEFAGEYNQFQEPIDYSSCNQEPVASSSQQESEETTKHNSKQPDDQKVANHELMSKIEAELEAELERLELNMKASILERISDFEELDPDFEADVIRGDLKVDLVQPGGGQSESDFDASGTSTNHTRTANYPVSPRELSLRLHEVIESRLEARIKELEAALQNSQKRVHSLEWQHLISQGLLAYGKEGSSSTPGSPIFINEVHDMDWPLVINLSGEAPDAYQAYEEIITGTDTDQDTPDAVSGHNRFEKEMLPFDKEHAEGPNKAARVGSISHRDVTEQRWPGSSVHDKIGMREVRMSRSQ